MEEQSRIIDEIRRRAMKDEKRYEWVDVTGECEAALRRNGCVVIIYRGDVVAISSMEGCRSIWDWIRVVPLSTDATCFRIDRRVEVEQPKPEPFIFWYTPENVSGLDCKNMSDESVLVHSVNKWNEVIAAHEAGVDWLKIKAGVETCPACAKYRTERGCGNCPLGYVTNCCNYHYGLYGTMTGTGRTAANARAVRDYIQSRLDAIRKPKPWVPQVGDRVRERSGAQGVIVYIAESGVDPIVVRLDKIDVYATFEYKASDLTLIEAAPK